MQLGVTLGISSLLTVVLAVAQGPIEGIASRPARARARVAPAIRVDVPLVLVPVSVTGPTGKPVLGLQRKDFHLFEDGAEQSVKYLSRQDAPASIGIVFDTSGSMEWKLDKARAAVSQFLRTGCSGDEYFLITFDDRPQLLTPFTDSATEIERTLAPIRASGATALLDAAYLALHTMRSARNPRRALLVLSDGGDNRSRYSESELRRRVREADTCIYAAGLKGPGLSKRSIRLLTELAEETGGRMFPVDKMAELPETVEEISTNIRNQYVLGYSSTKPDDGLYRKLEVRVDRPAGFPPLRATWRNGYYAPSP